MIEPYKLIKCSVPSWEKDFGSLEECVDELRQHICGLCLRDEEWEDMAHSRPIDVVIDGKLFECRDPIRLLGTACGLEYEIEGDLGFWERAS